MRGRTTAALGLLLVAAVGGVLVLQRPARHTATPASASASASAAPSASNAPEGGDGGDEEDPGSSAFDPGDAGTPRLPSGAPGQVGFGVILFTYEGAELAPKGARNKATARELAKDIIPEARQDFAAAAKKGDRGSVAEAGKISRGVLEPPVEFALFSLPKGQVADEPIDTPRGYWVLRRTE